MTDRKSKLILIVEDNEGLRETISSLLELEGLASKSVENGKEALLAIEKDGMPDLILLDMKMPVMDGWSFAREFQSRYHHQVPIIVLSAAEDTQKRAKEIDAEGWLSKPFDFDELINVVNKFLHGRP